MAALGVLVAVGAVVSTVMQAAGQINAGKAAQNQAEYNAGVSRNNAIQAQRDAQIKADQTRQQVARVIGKNRAAYAKAGVDLSGSVSDVQFQNATQGGLDALMEEYKGKLLSDRYNQESDLLQVSGRNAMSSARAAATGTVISGLFSAASGLSGNFASRSTPPEYATARPVYDSGSNRNIPLGMTDLKSYPNIV